MTSTHAACVDRAFGLGLSQIVALSPPCARLDPRAPRAHCRSLARRLHLAFPKPPPPLEPFSCLACTFGRMRDVALHGVAPLALWPRVLPCRGGTRQPQQMAMVQRAARLGRALPGASGHGCRITTTRRHHKVLLDKVPGAPSRKRRQHRTATRRRSEAPRAHGYHHACQFLDLSSKRK